MDFLRPALLAALLLVPPPALAQAVDESGTDGAETTPPPATISPPSPIQMPDIAWPDGAADCETPCIVRVQLRIDAEGLVPSAELESGAGEPFDTAVLEGVKSFRFHPARLGGEPVEVLVPYAHTFFPPPAPREDGAPEIAADAVLDGVVQQRGTRRPVAGATVAATSGGREFLATTGEDGGFRLPLPEGEAEVRIAAFGHRRFVQKERLEKDQQVRVRYLVDRESYDDFEVTITAQRERTEVSRTTLEGRELTKVPGTFGDPFKVITVLPGVTSMMSLLPLPVVRGSSPASTGLLLDGERVPLLFHLLAGPSVIHPEFIDRIDFYPGGFPVRYGGYTGGIVDGVTRRAKADESTLDLDMNLLQTGLFARRAIRPLGVTATVAGRIGYPAMLMSLAIPELSFSYWDYQARLDGGSGANTWTAFFYGANDALQTRERLGLDDFGPWLNMLRLQFHRGDLRYRRGDEQSHVEYRLVAGLDQTLFGPEEAGRRSWVLHPQATAQRTLSSRWALRGGLDGSLRSLQATAPGAGSEFGDAPPVFEDGGRLWTAGAWTEAVWRPAEAWMVVPGLRADLYAEEGTTKVGVDPRLTARFRLSDAPVGGTWLKGVVGLFHQPPRLPASLPGFDQVMLSQGLLGSSQVGVGAEVRLAPAVELDVQTYFNWMDPVLLELDLGEQQDMNVPPPGQGPPPSEPSDWGPTFAKKTGRSYGLEVLLRKRDSGGFFGWIAYTLSRSERRDASGWRTFDFDRAHILNVVGGVRLPRNWELGGRLLLQTGTPVATIHGRDAGRAQAQMRFDLRIDKRAVWNNWLLDFYVDVINATVAEESGGLLGPEAFRYVLPTIGFRAVL